MKSDMLKRARNSSRRLPLVALFLLLAMTAAGQTLDTRSYDTPVVPPTNSLSAPPVARTDGWVEVAPVGEEFTILMPSRPTLKREAGTYGQYGAVRAYGVNNDGGMYTVTSSPRPEEDAASTQALLNPLSGAYEQQFFKEIRKQAGQVNLIKERDLTLNGFKGREYLLSVGDTPCAIRVYVTRHRVYTLIWLYLVVADLPGPPYVDRFLESFRLGPMNSDVAVSNVNTGDDRTLVDGIGSGRGVGMGGVVEQGGKSSDNIPFDRNDTRVYGSNEVTQRARILSRPEPQYTEQAHQNNTNGTVVLKVVFTASGRVVNIQVVSGLPDGLTEKAIEAAKRIRFAPAIRDGHAVSQYAQIEYNFNLY